MFKDDVVKLVLEDTTTLFDRERLEKLRIVDHFELTLVGDSDTCRWNRPVDSLVDSTRKCRKERLGLQESIGVFIQVEWDFFVVAHWRTPLLWVMLVL